MRYRIKHPLISRIATHVTLASFILLLSIGQAIALCETPIELTRAENTSLSAQNTTITAGTTTLQARVTNKIPIEQADLRRKLTEFSANFRGNLGDMWQRWLQNLQKQTAQLNTATIDQTRNLLSAQDAAAFNDAERDHAQNEFESILEFSPDPDSCTFDSTAKHMGRVDASSTAVVNGMTEQFNTDFFNGAPTVTASLANLIYKRDYARLKSDPDTSTSARIISPAKAQTPTASQNQIDYDRYLNFYCNVEENDGNAPCEASGSRVDEDIEISKTLFGRDTLEVETFEDFIVIVNAIENLSARTKFSVISESDIKTTNGQIGFLRKRVTATQMTAAQGLFWSIAAERLPSNTEQPEIQDMRVMAGVLLSETSDKPGLYETRQAFIEHINTPQFVASLPGSPSRLAQKELHLKALRLMTADEMNERLERFATMISIQLSNQLAAKDGSDGEF